MGGAAPGGAANDGRDITGGGGAPGPAARGAGAVEDGRANGAGITGACIGRVGTPAGTGIPGRTGVDWRVTGVSGGGGKIAGAGGVAGIDAAGVAMDTRGAGIDALGVGIEGADAAGVGGELRAGVAAAAGVARAALGAKSDCALLVAAIMITAPHTEQRARTLADGIFAGSTRKTDRHSRQATFMRRLPRGRPSSGP